MSIFCKMDSMKPFRTVRWTKFWSSVPIGLISAWLMIYFIHLFFLPYILMWSYECSANYLQGRQNAQWPYFCNKAGFRNAERQSDFHNVCFISGSYNTDFIYRYAYTIKILNLPRSVRVQSASLAYHSEIVYCMFTSVCYLSISFC